MSSSQTPAPRANDAARLLRIGGGALAGALIALWAAATVAFVLLRVIPGDPVAVMLGPTAQVSDEIKAQMRTDLGLNDPLWQQYVNYLADALRGDFGQSYQLRKPVTDVIGQALPATLQLAGLALVLALLIVVIVTFAARSGSARRLATVAEQVLLATPVFWIGLLLLTVFAIGLGWFPISANRGFASLVLPALTLALPTAALLSQVLRDGIEAAEQQPFTETVRARGASSARLLSHHTLRHGLIGTMPMLAYFTGSLLGGAVLVETVFSRTGLGRTALDAILNRDLPVIAGIIVLSALVFTVVSLVADVVVMMLDPRQRGSVR